LYDQDVNRTLLSTAIILSASAAAFGCGTSRHTVEPYRSEPEAAAELEARAVESCEAMDPRDGVPAQAFITDGCSAFPDGDWVDCCVEHDIPYWCGGSSEQRVAADEAFRQCVAAKKSGWFGQLMEWGVRVGGHPWVPAGWRWGYGRAYGTCYQSAR